MTAPQAKRKKKKKTALTIVRRYWWLPFVLGGVVMIFWIATGPRWSRAKVNLPIAVRPISGYTANTATVLQEYLHFYGKSLHNADMSALQRGQPAPRPGLSHRPGYAGTGVEGRCRSVVFNNLFSTRSMTLPLHQRVPRSPGARHGYSPYGSTSTA